MSEQTASTPETPPPAEVPPPAVARARPFPWFPYALLALLSAAVLAVGLGMRFWWAEPSDLGVVQKIRLEAKQGIDLKKIEEVLDTPDYYLEIQSEQGSMKTEPFKDTPVGSGLTFTPPVPMRLADIKEIRVFDSDTVGKDTLVDRVDRPVWSTPGEKFVISMEGQRPNSSRHQALGTGLAVGGGAVLLLALLAFVRAQVV